MDSGVSWRTALATTRLQYPNADYFTIVYLAKQLYLINYSSKEEYAQSENRKRVSPAGVRGKLILQGAKV